MKNRYAFFRASLLAVLLQLPLGAMARVVGVDRASAVATRFLQMAQTRSDGRGVKLAWHSGQHDRGTRAGEAPLYYVFERSGGRGFVVVSGDDGVQPVLAYSLHEAAPCLGEMPEGLVWWFGHVSAQIRGARQAEANSTDPSVEVKHQRARVAKQWAQAAPGNVVTQLETALWNQSEPFNWQCPMVDGRHCITGCSSTAAAIVMRYHRWPPKGRGVTEAYTTEDGLSVPARDLNHSYDWTRMPLASSGFSDAEGIAISTLMADIGHAAQAVYGLDLTSSFVGPQILYKHFDYAPDMEFAWRADYTDDRWFALVKGELDADRPLLYTGGGGPRGSHAFVLDGYTVDDYFHVNWGWGGYCDGFFMLSNLNPGTDYFSDDQSAIFGVRPNDGSEPKEWLRLWNDLELSTDEVVSGQTFTFKYIELWNHTQLDFDGNVRVCLVSREGKIKEVVSREIACTGEAESGYAICDFELPCIINGPIDFGDRLRVYYKSKNSTEWHLVKAESGRATIWEVPVADESDIAGSTSFTFDRLHRIITLRTKKGVAARLFSESGEDLSPHLSIEGTTIRIPVRGLPAGSCTVRLTKGADIKELSFSVKPYTR